MKRAIQILLFVISVGAQAEGFYLEGGAQKYHDPYYFDGFRVDTTGHVAIGFDHSLTNRLKIDTQYRHVSDPHNVNDNDMIANESLGVSLRFYLWPD